MTKEEKELLFKDLCARLPYGVKVHYKGYSKEEDCTLNSHHLNSTYSIEYRKMRPYLRPMSSMTDEEKEEIKPFFIEFWDNKGKRVLVVRQNKMVWYQDWLNAHHFDYRNLIEKGLALPAPEGMYKTE